MSGVESRAELNLDFASFAGSCEKDVIEKPAIGSLIGYVRTGCGAVTKPDSCGKTKALYGCIDVANHNLADLNGHNYSGEVYVKRVPFSCHRLSCPVCWQSACARESDAVQERIAVASKKFGLPEHFSVNVPDADADLSLEEIRRKVVNALARRGIHGGCLVFHGERFHARNETYEGEEGHWFASFHFHCIGFLSGGYSRCRHCEKCRDKSPSASVCAGCDGFENLTRKMYEKEGGRSGSGYIVKVAEDRHGRKLERKSVFATCYYELSHCSVNVDSKRFHAVTWFGTCSYRKLKFKREHKHDEFSVCPICGGVLKKLHYVGAGLPDGGQWWLKDFTDSLYDASGNVKWVEAG